MCVLVYSKSTKMLPKQIEILPGLIIFEGGGGSIGLMLILLGLLHNCKLSEVDDRERNVIGESPPV